MSTDANDTPASGPQQTVNVTTVGKPALTPFTPAYYVDLVGKSAWYTILTVVACFMIYTTMTWARQDRAEDRAMFREMNQENNRRAGEVKGSVDALNGAVRDMTAEFREWRRSPNAAKPQE